MLTPFERAELKRCRNELPERSYAEIAAHLTRTLGRKISRNTVRHYLNLNDNPVNLPKGRPKGSVSEPGVWEQVIPELLSLTGLAASRLYRELNALLAPGRLPFRESTFHERARFRNSSQPRVQREPSLSASDEEAAREPTKGSAITRCKARATLLTRCRLRLHVVEVVPEGGQERRVYLFGYEEVTGYASFDLVASTQPSALQVVSFVRSMERHLALPVRRVCTINIELPEEDILTYLKDITVERSSEQMVSTQLLSPLEKKAELDLLLRLTRKQNNSVARSKALDAKLAIAKFVRSKQNDHKVRVWPVVDLQRRGLAAVLKPSLAIRFKLRTPSRRVVTF
jgi:hypothetical protein